MMIFGVKNSLPKSKKRKNKVRDLDQDTSLDPFEAQKSEKELPKTRRLERERTARAEEQ